MDQYFSEGLADESAVPNNPFEPEVVDNKQRGGRRQRRERGGSRKINGKRILILLAAVLILAAVLTVIFLIGKRRNDGARYARKLSESIGMTISAAEKNADITMSTESNYATLNTLYQSFQGLAESRKTCKIQGVRLPQWAIFCNTDVDELKNVTYYNYKVLEKNVFGTERHGYIDPNTVSIGSAPEQVEAKLELTPYRIQYLQGQTQVREYRYCYTDGNTGDTVAYVITAVWDENGLLSKITDARKNYIGSLLASPEPTA